MFEDLLYEVREHKAWITINRPEVRNAMRTQTYAELAQAVQQAGDDPTVGVVILTGAGTAAFSSGGDVRGQRGRTPEQGRVHLRTGLDVLRALRGCGKPTVAAVRGWCIGGGHELHLMCDITLAADNATFGQVGPRVGMVPVLGATQLLWQVIGEKRARELVYTTRFLDADEALAIGLVNHVYPLDGFETRVEEFCDRMLDLSPQSLRLAKQSMNMAIDAAWPSLLRDVESLAQFYGSAEQLEGSRAFLEKRQPDYRAFRRPSSADHDTEPE